MSDSFDQPTWTARRFTWWADHPSAQIFVLVLVSSLAILGYTNPSLLTDRFARLTAEDGREDEGTNGFQERLEQNYLDAANKPPPSNVRRFQVGGGECVLVVTIEEEGQDFFTPSRLGTLREVAKGLDALPQVSRILLVGQCS